MSGGGHPRRRVGREVVPLSAGAGAAVLAELLEPCRECVFWERGPAPVSPSAQRAAQDKAAWVSHVESAWGSPGWVVRVDGVIAGQLFLAPAPLAPRTLAFPTAPVSDDALVLLSVRIDPRYAGQGLGRLLIQTAAQATLERGHRAIEAFGTTRDERCLLPVGFLTAAGFRVVREHSAYPRVRLDLRTAVGWRGDVERALDRILAPVRRMGGRAPVGTANQDAPDPSRG